MIELICNYKIGSRDELSSIFKIVFKQERELSWAERYLKQTSEPRVIFRELSREPSWTYYKAVSCTHDQLWVIFHCSQTPLPQKALSKPRLNLDRKKEYSKYFGPLSMTIPLPPTSTVFPSLGLNYCSAELRFISLATRRSLSELGAYPDPFLKQSTGRF